MFKKIYLNFRNGSCVLKIKYCWCKNNVIWLVYTHFVVLIYLWICTCRINFQFHDCWYTLSIPEKIKKHFSKSERFSNGRTKTVPLNQFQNRNNIHVESKYRANFLIASNQFLRSMGKDPGEIDVFQIFSFMLWFNLWYNADPGSMMLFNSRLIGSHEGKNPNTPRASNVLHYFS